MSVTFLRLYTVLIGLWFLRHVAAAWALTGAARSIWVAITALWGLALAYLIMGRRIALAAWSILALIGLELVVMGIWNKEGVSMLAWLTLIVAATNDRPHERAFLVRVCVTVVYVFAVLTKLNPSWLAGEGVLALPIAHPPLAFMESILRIPAIASMSAVGVIFVEAFLAFGLWGRRTRGAAAAVGVVMHVAFVAVLSRTFFSFVHLATLNGGLMIGYVAFWEATRPSEKEKAPTDLARPDISTHSGSW